MAEDNEKEVQCKWNIEEQCRWNIEEVIFITQEICNGIIFAINNSKRYKREFLIRDLYNHLWELVDIDGDLIAFVHNNEEKWKFYSKQDVNDKQDANSKQDINDKQDANCKQDVNDKQDKMFGGRGKMFGEQVLLNIQLIEEYYKNIRAQEKSRSSDKKRSLEDESKRYYALRDKLECNFPTLDICEAIGGKALTRLFLSEEFTNKLFEYCKTIIKVAKINESFEIYERNLTRLYENFNKIIDDKELTSTFLYQINPFIRSAKKNIGNLICSIEQARHKYALKESGKKMSLKDRAYFLHRLFTDILFVDKSQEIIGNVIASLIGCEKNTMPTYINDFNRSIVSSATKRRVKEIFQILTNNTEMQELDDLIKLCKTQLYEKIEKQTQKRKKIQKL